MNRALQLSDKYAPMIATQARASPPFPALSPGLAQRSDGAPRGGLH
jgi:hypothetical protein